MTMQPKTAAKLAEIMNAARNGHEIIPAFFQPRRGIDASVSAAVRHAVKAGLLISAGKDGCGKPKYKIATPAHNHAGTAVPQ